MFYLPLKPLTMPSVSNKVYDAFLKTLADLETGIRKHSSTNTKIKNSLDVSEIRMLKDNLQSTREAYLKAEQSARVSYQEFEMQFKLVKQRLSNVGRIIKGIFGPKADELIDFGITPERSRSRRDKMDILSNGK